MAYKILVVEDDAIYRETLGLSLLAQGYEVTFCADGNGALDAFKRTQPDLVLLDVMLPGKLGHEVVGELKEFAPMCQVVMLSAQEGTDDVVAGIEAGADDYIGKTEDEKVLTAKIKARLRPYPVSTQSEGLVKIGPLSLDVVGHEVRRGDEKISLTPLEFSLLLILAENPREVFTREKLLDKVWGYHYKADTRLVNVHVQRLRSKIEDDPDDPKIVTTVRGVGYKAGQG